ncbi:MAG TPA: hypothetical protein VH478_16710 [Trebonia sp.]|nr:hypothetical protein [Trebonia sp.]
MAGPGRAPYPPLTLTAGVPLGAGFGTQDSTDGLHATNGVTVSGGAPGWATASGATATPIAGVPGLTADNAVDGALQQGGTGRYEVTVINDGGAPTNGSPASPVTATISARPAGVTITGLYGSGWTCNLAPVTAPRAEPASTCYRSDPLAGENGEEPPITVIAAAAANAAATGSETVTVSGGGDAAAPATASAATTILPAAPAVPASPSPDPAVLAVTSSHAGGWRQGDAADAYTLRLSSARAAGPVAGAVVVADTLPPGLTPVAMSGAGWTCSLAPATLPSTATRRPPPDTFVPQPSCQRPDPLAPGAAYPPITLRVAVADNAQPAVANAVTASGGGAPEAASGSDPTAIGQLPLLAVAGYPSASGTPYAPFTRGHGTDTIALTVANDGYAATSGPVTVTAALPAGLTPVAVSGTSGWTCQVATATCTTRPGVRLAAGQRDQLTVRVTVAAGAPPSAQVLLTTAGGGQVPAAAIDENNDYSTVANGGEYTVPAYIALAR